LLIDYGLRRSQLLAPERATGTIRAFRGQHVSSDVLSGVGRQDITAHVDLDALDSDALEAGFTQLGRTTQASFLMGCGLDEIYRGAKGEADHDWNSALELRSVVRRLLDPQHMGAYTVVGLGMGVSEGPPLRGFGFELQRPG
jgi:SAM-dependent MidA family methyltransferase